MSRSRAFAGWLAACAAATAVILVFILVMASSGVGTPRVAANVLPTLLLAIFVFPYVCVLSAIPMLITISLAARLKTASIVFFACAGAVAAVLSIGVFVAFNRWSWAFAIPGLAAGVAYWYVAGRYAGRAVPLGEQQA